MLRLPKERGTTSTTTLYVPYTSWLCVT